MVAKGQPRPKGAGPKPKNPEDRVISPKMKRLLDAYLLNGLNGKEAAIVAGYPEKSAQSQASFVINRPQCQKYIKAQRARVQKKHDVTLDRVIAEFARIGFSNMSDYIQDDELTGLPRFKLVGQIGRDKMAVVTELTVDSRKEWEGRGEDRVQVATIDRVKFKLADKVNALTALGKHLGMFPKDNGDDAGGNGVTVTVKVEGGLPAPGTKRPAPKPVADEDD